MREPQHGGSFTQQKLETASGKYSRAENIKKKSTSRKEKRSRHKAPESDKTMKKLETEEEAMERVTSLFF